MRRILGETDLHIAPIVFGGNVFGWTVNENESFEILDQFMALGFNFIDTANSYSRWKPGNSGGESETIIGNWLKKRGHRNDVIIATKVGSDMGSGKQLRKEYIINEAEQSLKRLQTDYIDLYFSHYDDLNLSVEEPLLAYEQLIKDGKVRWIGASNFSLERLREAIVSASANNLPRYQVLQPEYNLYDREKFESTYQQIAAEFNLGVIPYYSLASGFLTGKYRSKNDLDKSLRGGGISKYLDGKGFKVLAALDEVAKNQNVKPAAVALAWLLHQPTITAPIASATNLKQMESFTSAVTLKLNEQELTLLDEASA
jgi:aryl-alcohol dehydrogenase-like predicted oxidoreductase